MVCIFIVSGLFHSCELTRQTKDSGTGKNKDNVLIQEKDPYQAPLPDQYVVVLKDTWIEPAILSAPKHVKDKLWIIQT